MRVRLHPCGAAKSARRPGGVAYLVVKDDHVRRARLALQEILHLGVVALLEGRILAQLVKVCRGERSWVFCGKRKACLVKRDRGGVIAAIEHDALNGRWFRTHGLRVVFCPLTEEDQALPSVGMDVPREESLDIALGHYKAIGPERW